MEEPSQDQQPIFQFYTIENDPSFQINYKQDNEERSLCEGNLLANDEGSIFTYVTVNHEEDELNDSIGTVDPILDNVYENGLQITQPNAETLKLVTFENGQMYLTPCASSEMQGLTLIESQLPDNLKEDEATTLVDCGSGDDNNDDENVNLTVTKYEDELESGEPESSYHEIQLGDGTCALITTSLWNSMIEGNLSSQIAVEEQNKATEKRRRFPCTHVDCGKSFTTAHHLQVHMRIHTGNRPYACTVETCDKRFATGYSLKAHLRTHTGEKPYGCRVCAKHFKTSGDLQKHMRTHTGEKPFKCPIVGCGKYFTTSNIRKVHIRSHTGERPYACNVENCGKCFASATNYKNHMRIHSGEKPYQCSVEGCGKRFTEYSSLYKHNAVHQPYKMFQCEYCDQMFKFENTLKLHKKSVHSVIITEDGTEFYFSKELNSNQKNAVILELDEAEDLGAIDLNLLTDESSNL